MLKMMLHGTIGNDNFHGNTTLQCWNNVVTIRNNVAIMCNAVLRYKSSLRIVSCNITVSGEGNENGEETTIHLGLISKKKIFTFSTLFWYISLPVVLHDHNVKLQETSQLHVLWRKFRTCCCSLFFTRSFSHWWPLGFLIFSPPLKRFKIFILFFQQIPPYLPLQLSVALFLFELRWPVAHFIFSLYSKFVDMTINLSLMLQTTRIPKQFPLSVFVWVDSSDSDGQITKSSYPWCSASRAWSFAIIQFTRLLCDNSNSHTHEPQMGQSPTLSRANGVILHLILAFHSNDSNLNV